LMDMTAIGIYCNRQRGLSKSKRRIRKTCTEHAAMRRVRTVTNDILVTQYDGGETLRFIGESAGEWIETTEWQEIEAETGAEA